MDLYFHITKTGNLFHFISNLTDWNYSVRPSYKKFWTKKTGELTSQDKEWLSKADNLFRKYTFGDKYWGKVFLRRPENDVWEVAIQYFGEKDTERFKKVAEYFTPRFEKIWKKEEKLINKWRNYLKESEEDYIKNDLISDLNSLFNVKPDFSNTLKVILLICSPTTKGGGEANVGRGAVTLEVSRTKREDIEYVWGTFWHEISHVYWEQTHNYMNMLNGYLDTLKEKPSLGNIPYKMLMKEAVLEAFIPQGVLAEKYFNLPIEKPNNKEKSMHTWRRHSRYKLRNLAKEYLDENKKLDEKFLEKVNECLIRFLN